MRRIMYFMIYWYCAVTGLKICFESMQINIGCLFSWGMGNWNIKILERVLRIHSHSSHFSQSWPSCIISILLIGKLKVKEIKWLDLTPQPNRKITSRAQEPKVQVAHYCLWYKPSHQNSYLIFLSLCLKEKYVTFWV